LWEDYSISGWDYVLRPALTAEGSEGMAWESGSE
jgi:hypothetical protein